MNIDDIQFLEYNIEAVGIIIMSTVFFMEVFYLKNILIKNIDIITADKDNEFISNGQILISDGIIEFAGKGEIPEGFLPDKIIDGKNKLAMPGLVNAHTHSGMTLLRNYADDLALEDWLYKKIFPVEARIGEEDIYWGTMLAIIEMIKSGTTCFADMYLHMDQAARAVCESGIRANLSRSLLRFSADDRKPIDDSELCVKYHKDWHGRENGRLIVSLEVHSVYLFDIHSLKKAAQLAKSLGAGIQIHILETATERKESIKRYGMDSAEICAECGIFDVPVVAAHCVHLAENDYKILKSKKVSVAHNPTSNLKLGSGIANVPYMLEMGINVALGTDGTASNNNLNMFEEMHLAALIHKGYNMNPQLINAKQAIYMATANGAKAVGFGDNVGVIKKGMKADLIILNMDKPHLIPLNDPFSAVVYSAQASDVDTVIVNGEILMEGRCLTKIDEELVKHKVREISRRLLK